MDRVTFKRIAPDESRIYHDGNRVGDIYRQPDCLEPGAHYYVVHLDEDWRGPVRVHDRAPPPRGRRASRPHSPALVTATMTARAMAVLEPPRRLRTPGGPPNRLRPDPPAPCRRRGP